MCFHKLVSSLKLIGRRDIVCELASVRDFPLPVPARHTSNKREREPEEAEASPDTTDTMMSTPDSMSGAGGLPHNRPIAKGRAARQQRSQTNSSGASSGYPPEAGPSGVGSTSGVGLPGPGVVPPSGLPGFAPMDPMFPNGLPMGTSELAQAPIDPMYNQYFGHSGFTPESVNWLPVEAQALMSADTAGLISHVNFPDPFLAGLGIGVGGMGPGGVGMASGGDPSAALLASLGQHGHGLGAYGGAGPLPLGTEALFGASPVPSGQAGPGPSSQAAQQGLHGSGINNLGLEGGMPMWANPQGWNWNDWAGMVGQVSDSVLRCSTVLAV